MSFLFCPDDISIYIAVEITVICGIQFPTCPISSAAVVFLYGFGCASARRGGFALLTAATCGIT